MMKALCHRCVFFICLFGSVLIEIFFSGYSIAIVKDSVYLVQISKKILHVLFQVTELRDLLS